MDGAAKFVRGDAIAGVIITLINVLGGFCIGVIQNKMSVAEAAGTPARRINGPDELDMTWLDGIQRVGVTSGASTPEAAVDAVVKALRPDRVTDVGGPEEHITFTLPPGLRDTDPGP